MKKIIITLLSTSLFFSTLAIAKETSERLSEFKQKLLHHIDNEVEILSQFKTCIQAAQKANDFEHCKDIKNAAQHQEILKMQQEQLNRQKNRLAREEKQLDDAAKLDKK